MPVPLDDQIAVVQREIRMRQRVYKRWVADGKMKSDTAKAEQDGMAAVLETLLAVQRKDWNGLDAAGGLL